MYRIENRNTFMHIPKCPCGNNCHVNKSDKRKGFTKYCSDECSKKYRSMNKQYNVLMSDYSWLYEQRIILKKSKDTIAGQLGCSHTVVNKWLKYHNIPNVRYNESNTETLLLLRDYDYMYQEHKVSHKSCEDIANDLGITKSTVSVWLNKHNITTNESNSYPRNNYSSGEEKELLNFLEEIYKGKIETNVRNICKGGLEIDIYLPEINLAFEYNGVYSHLYRPEENSFSSIKGPKYHLQKTQDCLDKGIQLIHIFSSSWNEKKDLWKNFIKNKLRIYNHRIYARNCSIKEVSVYDKNIFLDENHLQGKDKSLLKYGLYHNDTLVALMTFTKARFTKKIDWELSRFAVKGGHSVIGGFTKLLNHMTKNNIGTIVSYADRTYSNGNVYSKNGFELVKINKPSYYYKHKNSNILINRMNLTKKQLLKKLNMPQLTEENLARELGYSKIFDCGTLTFILR